MNFQVEECDIPHLCSERGKHSNENRSNVEEIVGERRIMKYEQGLGDDIMLCHLHVGFRSSESCIFFGDILLNLL